MKLLQHIKSAFVLFSIVLPVVSIADDLKTVEGEATFRDNGSYSRDESKRIALERARHNALEKAFGTNVSQNVYQQGIKKNDQEQSYFNYQSETEVRGEWISDLGDPEYKISLSSDDCFIVTCKIKGKARALSNEAIDFEADVLKLVPDKNASARNFNNDDPILVYFRAPSDGYVLIYLVDDQQNAQCLLPYFDDPNANFKVKKGEEYFFFDPNSNHSQYVESLRMATDNAIERDELYVIFSPNPFNKAIDSFAGDNLPRELSLDDFLKWRRKTQNNDKKMSFKKFSIEVHNPNVQRF